MLSKYLSRSVFFGWNHEVQTAQIQAVLPQEWEIISCTGLSWAVKKGRPRSTGSQTAPDDASIQELPRSITRSMVVKDSLCPGCHSGTHGKGSYTFPWVLVPQLVIPALLVPPPISLLFALRHSSSDMSLFRLDHH